MKKLLALLLALASPALGQSVQQSGLITPGHVAQWITNGVIADGGAPSGGASLLGSFTANDMLCANATGTAPSIIDCGISPSGANSWSGLQNFNGGATAPTRAYGDISTNVATTAFAQSAFSGTAPTLVTSSTWGVINGAITVSSAPSYTFPEAIATEFQGDFSHVYTAQQYTVTGTAMGNGTNYWSPAVTPHQLQVNYSSGTNTGTGGNTGRTGFGAYRVQNVHNGQGDLIAYYSYCEVDSVKAGATNFLASPACVHTGADLNGRAAGAYLEGIGDINLKDNGFDVAGIADVRNMTRTVNTAALGEIWAGYYVKSLGSAALDAFAVISGPTVVGLDTVLDTTANLPAVNMAAGQKIVFNSTASAIGGINWYGNNIGTAYLSYSTGVGGLIAVSGNTTVLELTSTQDAAPVPFIFFPPMVANTSADGAILSNTLAATSGNQEYSPRVRFTGQGWKTNATAGSQEVDAIVELRPLQAAASPDSSLQFNFQVNAGGYPATAPFQMNVSNNGNGSIFDTNGATAQSAQHRLFVAGTQYGTFYADTTQFIIGSVTTIPVKGFYNNAAAITWGPGLQIGSPTGGDKGAGTLNVAGTIWTNGTQGVASTTCTVTAGNTLVFTNGLLTTKGANCT